MGELYGTGTLSYSNKDKYAGEFIDSEFNGTGTYTTADNRIYSGDILDGEFTDPYQSRLIGKFVDGMLECEGDIYQGQLSMVDIIEKKP